MGFRMKNGKLFFRKVGKVRVPTTSSKLPSEVEKAKKYVNK